MIVLLPHSSIAIHYFPSGFMLHFPVIPLSQLTLWMQGASVPMVKRSKMMAALEDVSGSDSEDSQ